MENESKLKNDLLQIWRDSIELQRKLDELDKIKPVTRDQWDAIQSAQNSFFDWRGFNLGELLNMFGLPPEDRH